MGEGTFQGVWGRGPTPCLDVNTRRGNQWEIRIWLALPRSRSGGGKTLVVGQKGA